MRIALIKEGFEDTEPDVAEIVKKAASILGSLGAIIEEISFPPHVDGIFTHFSQNYVNLKQTISVKQHYLTILRTKLC